MRTPAFSRAALGESGKERDPVAVLQEALGDGWNGVEDVDAYIRDLREDDPDGEVSDE